MKKLQNCLKSVLVTRRAEGYIDVVLTVFIAVMLLILCLNTFEFFALKQNMDHYGKELIAAATTDGQISANITTRRNELTAQTGISPALTWNTTYFNSSQRTVQYGKKIELSLTLQAKFKGFGVFSIPVTLTTKHSGLSQRYWKTG